MNEEFFHNISLFLNNNPNIRITEAFHTSSDYIIKNFNIYLPFIYKNISNSKGFNSFGRQLILSYALNNKNRIKAVDWYNGLSGNNILRIEHIDYWIERIYIDSAHVVHWIMDSGIEHCHCVEL